MTAPRSGAQRTLADFTLPSVPGNERRAVEEVARAVSGLGLPERTLERLKTAVAEANMITAPLRWLHRPRDPRE